MSKNDGRHGAFEEDLQRYMSRGRRSTRDIFIRDVRRSGRKRGCSLHDPASLFRGRRNILNRWNGQIAKHIDTRPSALHPTSILEGNLAELLRF